MCFNIILPYSFMSQRKLCWKVRDNYARLVWRMPAQKRWLELMVITATCEVADNEFSYTTFGQIISLQLMYFGPLFSLLTRAVHLYLCCCLSTHSLPPSRSTTVAAVLSSDELWCSMLVSVPSLACQLSRKNSSHIARIFNFVIFNVRLHL
jgi:hypothetical protein